MFHIALLNIIFRNITSLSGDPLNVRGAWDVVNTTFQYTELHYEALYQNLYLSPPGLRNYKSRFSR